MDYFREVALKSFWDAWSLRRRSFRKCSVRAFLSLVLPYTAKCVSIKRRQDLRGLQPRSGLTLARSYYDGS